MENNEEIKTSKKQENNPYLISVPKLTNGMKNNYEPALKNVQEQLNELNEKQETLLNQIHTENLSLSEVQFNPELEEMFNRMKVYQNKLSSIKKDMKMVHERGIKLKKRALKLQQIKEKEQYIKKQKELELQKEQDLIEKPK